MTRIVVTGMSGSLGTRVARGLIEAPLGTDGASTASTPAPAPAPDIAPTAATAHPQAGPPPASTPQPQTGSGSPALPDVVGIDIARPAAVPVGVEFVELDLAPGTRSAAADVVEQLEKVLLDTETVVHLAWDAAGDPSKSVNGLSNVLEAATSAGVHRVVFVSSAAVYGARPDNPIPLFERAAIRPNPEFDYAVEKAEAERLLFEWAENHPDRKLAVLRPTATLGQRDQWLWQALGGAVGPAAGDGSRPVQFLHVDDLASAVSWVCRTGATGVFNVAPDNGIPEDSARAIAGGMARLSFPGRVGGAVSTWTWKALRRGVPRNAREYSRHPWVVSAEKLLATGWAPRYSSEEALVAADPRVHWDDVAPGKRQKLAVVLGVSGVALAGWGTARGLRALSYSRRPTDD